MIKKKKHGRSQFMNIFALSIKIPNEKEHGFITRSLTLAVTG